MWLLLLYIRICDIIDILYIRRERTMTLPDERYRAILLTSKFLLDLVGNRELYPRVPKAVREQARGLLRHYPNYYDLKRLSDAAPDVVAETVEDLHRFILKGSEDKTT
jgi:hypothetical protein